MQRSAGKAPTHEKTKIRNEFPSFFSCASRVAATVAAVISRKDMQLEYVFRISWILHDIGHVQSRYKYIAKFNDLLCWSECEYYSAQTLADSVPMKHKQLNLHNSYNNSTIESNWWSFNSEIWSNLSIAFLYIWNGGRQNKTGWFRRIWIEIQLQYYLLPPLVQRL